MKKTLFFLLTLFAFLNLGSADKYEYKYQPDFAPFVYEGINDSIPTIDVFGRVRNGIIAQNIIDTLNTDPSGVDLTEPEMAYIRSIVGGLYVIGVWQKCLALYGFVGGNAWKHKWNWKDMRDADDAFRITWNGTITHNVFGIKGDGTTGYGETYFIPSVNGVQGDSHLSIYCNETTSTDFDGCEIGAYDDINIAFWRIRIKNTLAFSDTYFTNSTATDLISPSFIGYNGYFISSINGTSIKMYIKGLDRPDARGIGGTGNGLPQISINILRQNTAITSNIYSTKRLTLATIGSGLTDTQALQMSNIVTFAQGILSRQ